MVSRVYTPLITPYQRSQNVGNGRGPVSSATEENRQPSWNPPGAANGESTEPHKPSAGLQAVQYNQFQKIPLNAVIHDFKNTMSALGADESTQAEVAAYLNVVRLQAAKDQPEVGFIKQTLRTAANSLDQYIGKALGQPSKVVKEWVDALLMQDIDYKADIAPEEIHDPPNTAEEHAQDKPKPPVAEEATAHDEANALKTSTKSQLRSLIETAKAQQQQKSYDQADRSLEQALQLLQDKNKPEWEGKIWGLRGRILDQSGQWEKAVNAFDQAAHQFAQANLPQKQSQALQAMASILEDHGELQKAKGYYQQVVALDERANEPATLVRSLSDLGSISLRTGDTAQAISALQKAANHLRNAEVSPSIKGDVLGNLAAAYRKSQDFPNAIENYRQVLGAAKQSRDKIRYTSTLQQLASVYAEANQPEQAMKTLQRLKNLA